MHWHVRPSWPGHESRPLRLHSVDHGPLRSELSTIGADGADGAGGTVALRRLLISLLLLYSDRSAAAL
jgi:hypothetical protein